jgi:hypothetical protein
MVVQSFSRTPHKKNQEVAKCSLPTSIMNPSRQFTYTPVAYLQDRHPLDLDGFINPLILSTRDPMRVDTEVVATVATITKITG